MLELSKKSLCDFKDLVNKPAESVIIMHMNPDADALCSSLGLAEFLESHSHTVTVVSPTEIPKYLDWVENIEKVIVHKDNQDKVKDAIEFASNIFMVDFSHFSRIGNELSELVKDSSAVKVVIDHHVDPDYDMADIFIHSTEAAAASEIIYSALKELNYDVNLSSSIATQFYTGMVTDTGSFRHSSTTSNSHLVASELLSLGAQLTNVHKNLHENSTFQKIKFLGYMIAEKFVFVEEQNYGYAIINEVDFKKFDASYEDIESIINQAMSIDALKLFILAKQNHEGYRISLRSKENLDCRQIAHEFFSGGGHTNASGGIYSGTDKDLVKYISSIPFDIY